MGHSDLAALTATVPKITVSRAGNTLTVTDGRRTRQSVCANAGAAKSQETRLKNDKAYAARWLKAWAPEQLTLPLPEPEVVVAE